MTRRALALPILVLLLIAAAGSPCKAADLGYGVLVGRVENCSDKATSRHLIVWAGGVKWVVHADTERISFNRSRVSVHDIHRGVWIKVVGERIGHLRVKAAGIDILGGDHSYRRSRAFRRAHPNGYFVYTR